MTSILRATNSIKIIDLRLDTTVINQFQGKQQITWFHLIINIKTPF